MRKTLLATLLFTLTSVSFAGEQCFTMKFERENLALIMASMNKRKNVLYRVEAPASLFSGQYDQNGEAIRISNLSQDKKALIVKVHVKVKSFSQTKAEKSAYALLKNYSTLDNVELSKYVQGEILGSWILGARSCNGFEDLDNTL